MNLKNLLIPVGVCAVLMLLVASTPSPPTDVTVLNDPLLSAKAANVTAGESITIPAFTTPISTDPEAPDFPGRADVGGQVIDGELLVLGASGALHGTAEVSGNSIVYTANAESGDQQETLTVQCTSRFAGADTGLDSSFILTIAIAPSENPAPPPPVAVDDSYEQVGQTQLFVSPFVQTTINATANDENLNSPIVTIDSDPANGTAVVNDLGQIVYTHTNAASFASEDQFTYKVTNADGRSDTATVKVKIEQSSRAFISNETDSEVTVRANGREVIIQPQEIGELDFIVSRNSGGQITETEFTAYNYDVEGLPDGYENGQGVSLSVRVSPFQGGTQLRFTMNPEPKLMFGFGTAN